MCENRMYNMICGDTLPGFGRVFSVKRFESTGQISLVSLTKLAIALGMADELRSLFTEVPYRNIQEVINERK